MKLTFQDLLDAVEKINSSLSKKEETKGSYYFHQDEISSFGLGMSILSLSFCYIDPSDLVRKIALLHGGVWEKMLLVDDSM